MPTIVRDPAGLSPLSSTLLPDSPGRVRGRRWFRNFAWFVLAYNIAVILWGAYVRATGSGAGCGDHWPLCNGEVIPRAPSLERMIEFSHRATSGIALLLVVGMLVAGFRLYPRGHAVRRGVTWSTVFILTEALIGAGLVLFRLVAHDASLARGVSLSAHLVNTLILVAFLTLTAWWASGGSTFRLRGHGMMGSLLIASMAGVVLTGMSGAIAALGDTLFPASSVRDAMAQDWSAASHLFVRLRLLHPVLAVATALATFAAAVYASVARPSRPVNRLSGTLLALVVAQLLLGLLNVYLLAPVWIQLVHLLLADLVWIALVLLTAVVLSQQAISRRQAAA